MQRYILFYGGHYYPNGGWFDKKADSDDFAEVETAAKVESRKEYCAAEWWHIVDSTTGEIVAKHSDEKYVKAERFTPSSEIDEDTEVEVIYIGTLCYQQGWDDDVLSYQQIGERLREWCADNNGYYYARPGDMFSVAEACKLAIENDKCRVVVEDMS